METTTKIEMRSLGATGIQVTPVGLGVMQFAGGAGLIGQAFPVLEQAEKTSVLKAALDGGMNWFDTAELYGAGQSERNLAHGLQDLMVANGAVVIATKWWPMFRTARSITKTIDERIRCLEPYTIDLYYVHQPFNFSSPEAEMDAMAELVKAGKVRSVGVSNFSAEYMRRAYNRLEKHGLPLAANQVEYSLVKRRIERDGTLEMAKKLGVTIVAYTPLGYGLLSGVFHHKPELLAEKKPFYRARVRRMLEPTRPLVQALERIGERYGAAAGQVALNWVINAHGSAVVTIPGASKASQAAQSAAAMRFTITPDEVAELNRLSAQFV